MAGAAFMVASATCAVIAGLTVVNGAPGGASHGAALSDSLERWAAGVREGLRAIPAVRQARERDQRVRRRSSCLR